MAPGQSRLRKIVLRELDRKRLARRAAQTAGTQGGPGEKVRRTPCRFCPAAGRGTGHCPIPTLAI